MFLSIPTLNQSHARFQPVSDPASYAPTRFMRVTQQHSSWLQYKHTTFISFGRKEHAHIWRGKLENCGSCVVKISGAVSHSPTAAKTIKICKSTVKDANKRINYTDEYRTAGIHLYEVYLLWNSTDVPTLPTEQMRNGSCQEYSDAAVLWVPPHIWKLPDVCEENIIALL